MTTPAPCTRTDPHDPHGQGVTPDRWLCDGVDRPAYVEPPADVQADPRLNVVAQVLYENLHVTVGSGDFVAQRILDALDAMRPDEPDTRAYPDCDWCNERNAAPAPAGPTPAQEIRRWIEFGADIATKAIHVTTMVEHGPDETPAPGCTHDLERWADDLRRLTDAESRADLASARLGLIFDALQDYEAEPGPDTAPAFRHAVRDALGWEPAEDGPSGKDGE